MKKEQNRSVVWEEATRLVKTKNQKKNWQGVEKQSRQGSIVDRNVNDDKSSSSFNQV